jgi:tetratricopeptide (TPR) repeat protein
MKKKERLKGKKNKKPIKVSELSSKKKRIFLGITIILPFLFLILLEIGLRIFNYGVNLDLFIEGPEGYSQFMRVNPNVARRYFYLQKNVPTPPKQLFLKNKPANCYRIFVLGESSAAGFPYGYNACFSNILERGLINAFPDKKIEVINVAMAAINSYTLLDFMDEILEQSPDAFLIYTGHNEYYGAMGVGSTESTGITRWLTLLNLDLRSYKTFILTRNFVGWMKKTIGQIFYSGNETDPSQTLMERIVAEQTIPFHSKLYEAGKRQFEENMEVILKKTSEHKVPVVLSELVSNIRDQKPFISVNDGSTQSANSLFDSARNYEKNGEFEKARSYYFKAKDADALRFRAPGEFNSILKELSKKYSCPLVPMESIFEKNCPNGLIGNSLMLEHLHPNLYGHFLIAKAFYNVLKENNFISNNWAKDGIEKEKFHGLTELDSVSADLQIRFLKGGWPFQSKELPNRFLQNFIPGNYLEEIAYRIIKTPNYSIESAHMELGDYYKKQGEFDKAFYEYNALITCIPYESEFYRKAVTLLIEQKEYDKASELLQKSLRYNENNFANKWIGQLALMKNDFNKTITFLLKADLSDPQVVFNLSRAYYQDNQWYKGEEYFNRLIKLSPRPEYISYLRKLRTEVRQKSNQADPVN